ncbi:PREDICTED: insulin-like peptide INSL5 [Fulmarus glacialis]|uniref:insulin-like peptide INSL5 n=1 Tax=Fulmarus glacialis TaxID=30455 RepID=UPI00051C66E9|nr:PREDICTED: insulin-like peptide INSL5 [Fulmarus glacialis]
MRCTVLALAFLALLIAACEGRGEGNTVKLCGRDFVRAIVFTCGGSRWKRHLTDYHYLFASNFYATESENPLPFSQENNAYADSSTYAEQRLETDGEEIHSVKPETERDVQRARKMSMLKKREVAKLLTTSCCSIGCSEREISSLC